MNREFDDLVRDSMTRFTDGIDVPAGLAAQARQHLARQRQRRARMGWLATGTAVTAVAAVFIATAAGGAAGGAGPAPAHPVASGGGHAVTVQTTAMVISQVDRALAKAAAAHPVAYTRQVDNGIRLFVLIPHGQPTQIQGQVTETWSRGPLEHVQVVSRTGKVTFSTETDNSSGKSVQTMVSYPQRVWWRGTYAAPTVTKPALACTLGEITRTPAQWTREVRKLLSCGAAVAGHQRVDGVNTIKLKLSSSYQRHCVASNYQSHCTPQAVGWTGVLWANASSFLPVRLKSHGQRYSFQIDFRWLAPSAASLALLHQPIPAGFRHV